MASRDPERLRYASVLTQAERGAKRASSHSVIASAAKPIQTLTAEGFWIASLRSQRRGYNCPDVTIPLCGKHARQYALATFRALAALSRMRHDCSKSNNQAAIRVRRDKGRSFSMKRLLPGIFAAAFALSASAAQAQDKPPLRASDAAKMPDKICFMEKHLPYRAVL